MTVETTVPPPPPTPITLGGMSLVDKILLRTCAAVVILGALWFAGRLYANNFNARTHDTVAQRKAADDCIVAGGDVYVCDSKYDPPHEECKNGMSMDCFETIFKPDEF